MMRCREEAGDILRKCVVRFAGEKGANLETGAIQKGQGISEQKENFPVLGRESK